MSRRADLRSWFKPSNVEKEAHASETIDLGDIWVKALERHAWQDRRRLRAYRANIWTSRCNSRVTRWIRMRCTKEGKEGQIKGFGGSLHLVTGFALYPWESALISQGEYWLYGNVSRWGGLDRFDKGNISIWTSIHGTASRSLKKMEMPLSFF